MKRPKRLPELVFSVSAAVITALGVAADYVTVLAEQPWVGNVAWGTGLTAAGVAVGFGLARWRWLGDATVESLKAHSLVFKLHKRWFQTEGHELDKDYRVSMFVPTWDPETEAPSEWSRITRSAGRQTECVWPHPTDPAVYSYSGIVVKTAIVGEQDVVGVPEDRRKDQAEVDRYFEQSWVDARVHGDRGWPFATLRTYVSREESGRILCIFVVERRSGMPIHAPGPSDGPTDGQEPFIDACRVELQLAAEVWAAAWGGRGR